MSLLATVDPWLKKRGYEHHCYISWARTKDRNMPLCAKILQKEVKMYLSSVVDEPSVFLDKRDVRGGDLWEKTIGNALCKSISMIAICAPIYYHRKHNWCGLEWAAMEELFEKRIPDASFKSIIPVMYKRQVALPKQVQETQFLDVSKAFVQGPNYYTKPAFKKRVVQIVERIGLIGDALVKNNASAECSDFSFPDSSAFEDYHDTPQPFPFGGF